MRFWQLFWTISLVVAGSSFAFITLMVTIKGGKDLREMFRHLGEQREHKNRERNKNYEVNES